MAATRRDLGSIRPGDFVCLTDDQTVKDMLETEMHAATDGLQLEVEKVMHIREKQGMCDWYLCPLQGSCPENYPQLWLLVKAVDGEFEVRVYWVPDEFQDARTRGDLINDGILWLFKEPQDEIDFRPCELEFTGWIDHETGNGITKFDAKVGELHGECRETPITERDDPTIQDTSQYVVTLVDHIPLGDFEKPELESAMQAMITALVGSREVLEAGCSEAAMPPA